MVEDIWRIQSDRWRENSQKPIAIVSCIWQFNKHNLIEFFCKYYNCYSLKENTFICTFWYKVVGF